MIVDAMMGYTITMFDGASLGLGWVIPMLTLFGMVFSEGEVNPHLSVLFEQVNSQSGGENKKRQYKITVTSPTAEIGIIMLEANHSGRNNNWISIIQTNEMVVLTPNKPHKLFYNSYMSDNDYYRLVLSRENQTHLYSPIFVKNSEGFSPVDWKQVQNNEKVQLYIGIGIIIAVLIIMAVVAVYIHYLFDKNQQP
ncbi:hypothetical protein PAEPH01_0294 [Pancytospora epiphaga]|nr:hypothetical protein PAEPH01_0294 [Pancytospora epiphaga]